MSDSATNIAAPRGRGGCLAMILAFVGLGGGGAWWADRNMVPTLIAGPMVQMPEAGKLTIVWEWEPQGTTYLRWSDGARSELVPATEHGDRFEAVIQNVDVGQTVQYSLAYGGLFGMARDQGPTHTVRMPPDRKATIRFIAFGDSGSGGNGQYDLAAIMARQKCDLVIHTGDLIYPAGAPQDYYRKFYDPYAALIASAPFMASLGNHDCATDKGAPLLRQFVLPQNGPAGIEPERNFWFDYGSARFVALDTNRSTELGTISFEDMKAKVAPWLREVLSSNDARWKFVFFHHPPYTGSTHDAGGQAFVKDAFSAILDDTGVDMVFTGHNHLYERTAPIRGDKVVGEGEGPVYITTGAGGAPQYPEELPPPAYMRFYKDKIFSFSVIDLAGDKLTLRQIDENENVIDEYVIDKSLKARGTSAATGPPMP